MTPENELGIGTGFEVIQRYTCKNRVTKAKIKMVCIKYIVNGKDAGRGVYLTCLDHNETLRCKNKTEALYQVRQPWVWCDECSRSQIHFNTEWQNQLHHGVEDETMTDKSANTEIRKEFCPNCEAVVPFTHVAELFACDICGEDFAKYIVSRNCNVSDVSMTQDVLTDIKTPSSIEDNNPDYYKHDAVKPSEDNGWISVNDRLPEKDEIYLAYPTLTGKVYPVRYFARVGWRTIQFESVTAQEPTHWMPLPPPPESEE